MAPMSNPKNMKNAQTLIKEKDRMNQVHRQREKNKTKI